MSTRAYYPDLFIRTTSTERPDCGGELSGFLESQWKTGVRFMVGDCSACYLMDGPLIVDLLEGTA